MSPASVITLAILMCFSVLTQCQNFTSFKDKHIVQDNATIVCDNIIKERQIKNGNKCKQTNTFIYDTNGKRVKMMCENIIKSTVVVSDVSFKLTDCELQHGSPPVPNCAYDQKNETGKIYITCENHYPVHFVKFEPSAGVPWTPSILMAVVLMLLHLLL